MQQNTKISTQKYAQTAGIMYLVVILIYMSGEFITSSIVDSELFLEKARQVSNSENLYRFGLSLKLLSSVLTVILAFSLYKTIAPYNNGISKLALYWRVGESILGGVHVMLSFLSFLLYTNAHSNTFKVAHLEPMTILTNEGHFILFNISVLFFSFGSVLFFYLFLKSKFLPTWISSLGIVSSITVIATSFGNLIFPAYGHILQFGWLLMFVSETVTGVWLIFKGVDLRRIQISNG